MPISFTNYQPGTPAQTSPFADLLKNAMAAYQTGVKSRYAQPMAEQGLVKAVQENQWNPKIWQSEIGLRGSQSGLYNQEAKWWGPKSQAEISLQEAQAKNYGSQAGMNQLKLDYLRKMLEGGNNQSVEGGSSPGSIGGNGSNVSSSSTQATMNEPSSTKPSNSVYGIDTPQPSQQDIVNKMLLGVDTFTPKMENAKNQQQAEYKAFQEGLTESVKEANSANNMNQAIKIFNNAMDASSYKGPFKGMMPSSGWETAIFDVKNEQQADRAALQMLPAAMTTLRDAMGNARFSNLDTNYAAKMKFDRTMSDETRDTQTKWIGAINDRMQEKPKFYSVLGNPKSGAQKTQADALWQEYQNQFPLIAKDGQSVLNSNLHNWPLYTTPKAVESIRRTGTYTPTASEKNTFMMAIPDGQGNYVVAPVKKGKVESAIRKGAKVL
jgi:hypothetical protein